MVNQIICQKYKWIQPKGTLKIVLFFKAWISFLVKHLWWKNYETQKENIIFKSCWWWHHSTISPKKFSHKWHLWNLKWKFREVQNRIYHMKGLLQNNIKLPFMVFKWHLKKNLDSAPNYAILWSVFWNRNCR